MKIPSDYIQGYEAARSRDPETASNYVAHTTIGDPEADYVVERLAPLGQEESRRLIRAGMNSDEETLRDAPSYIRDFFKGMEDPPDWVDFSAYIPGIRMFHRNSQLVLGAFVGGVLVEGFSTNIGKSFYITGRLRDQGVRRLKQNNRHMVEIFMPGGLERNGDGWKLSVRIRLVHAQVRHLLNDSSEWEEEEWGIPLSSAHLGFAISAFSARLIKHLKSLGAVFNDEEREAFMQIWRYSGYLMGIPETILYQDEEHALKIFEIGGMCEPPASLESIVMANALVNSAPLVIGIENPEERSNLSGYVYKVSRALIGDELADELMYPKSSSFGVLPWFRMQSRFSRFLDSALPHHMQDENFKHFTTLLEASLFDEAGITFRLPDHLYSERSKRW